MKNNKKEKLKKSIENFLLWTNNSSTLLSILASMETL